jgi:hypothetical protein
VLSPFGDPAEALLYHQLLKNVVTDVKAGKLFVPTGQL